MKNNLKQMRAEQVFLAIFVFLIQISYAQLTFETKVSKKKLGINERLRVDFKMNQDGDNFVPPNFKGFKVIGGPNQSISNSWVNGKSTYTKTFSYFLSPTARGKFTIGQATIQIDNQIFKTSPVTVEVTAAIDQPKNGNNSDYLASENLHLVAEISNANPYLNEAITVVYKLYVSPRISVSNWQELDSPKFSDFWSQSIDVKQLNVERGSYKGEDYRFVVLRRALLYPQKTGKLNIEPLTLSVAIEVPTNRRDIFGGRLYTTVDKTIAASNRSIQVKALPTKGKPKNFTGAVGNFKFAVKANKTTLDATASLDVKVSVTGSGNLKLFDLPKLQVPNGLEQYEPEHQEQVRTKLNGMTGKVSDSYTLVPQFKGSYPIPELTFSFFDPKTESYKSIASKEIIISVKNGPDYVLSNSNAQASVSNKQQVTQQGTSFRFLKSDANLKPIDSEYFFGSTAYWTTVISPLLAIPVFLLLGKRRKERLQDTQANRSRKKDKLARKYLSESKKNIGNQKDFYVALEKSIHNYLKAKLKIQSSDLSKDKIKQLLQERGLDGELSEACITLLQNCELARYTPSASSAMQQDYEQAKKIISSIDRQL